MIFATCMLNVAMSCSNDCSVPRMRRGTCWRRSTDCPCTRTIRPSVSRKCRRRLPPDSSPALWTLLPTTTSWTPARQAGLYSGQVCSVSTRQSFHKVVLKYPKPTLMIMKAFLKVQVLLQFTWDMQHYKCQFMSDIKMYTYSTSSNISVYSLETECR